MQRRHFLVVGGTAVAGALAGCISSAQETSPETSPESTVRVSETGEISADPDVAVVQVGVEATGDDAEAVRSELAERSETLRNALIEFGIDEDDVTTGRFHIRERRSEGSPPRETDDRDTRIVFEGIHTLTVEADADEAGAVVDAAVDAGADDVGRVTFTLSEKRREALHEEAVERAIENARANAELIAAEVDARIVGVKSIDAADNHVRPAYAEAADGDAAGSRDVSTELHPDDVTVTARVEIVYYLVEA